MMPIQPPLQHLVADRGADFTERTHRRSLSNSPMTRIFFVVACWWIVSSQEVTELKEESASTKTYRSAAGRRRRLSVRGDNPVQPRIMVEKIQKKGGFHTTLLFGGKVDHLLVEGR